MVRNITIGITNMLAILMLVPMMNVIGCANEGGLSLPQHGSGPVTVRFSEGAVDWDDAKATDMLQVYVGAIAPCCEGRTPVAGRYALDNNSLTFTPAFSFVTGQDYVARVRIAGMDEKLVKFSIPSDISMMEARVTDIYPRGDVLPENVLRFYIHFSMPMSPHVAFDHIKLRDSSGIVDEAAFMRFKQELWNEDRTRLTVLIDPGRIKRDVATNLELGPALREGGRYVLAIDGGWPSADGSSVLPAFSKSFSVGKALRERPDVRFWQSTSPCPGTKQALEIDFDRPFDRHQLGQAIRVVTDSGQAVAGQARIGENETSWRFVPEVAWVAGELHITVSSALEDIAGNNFRDLLDQRVRNEDSGPSVTMLTIHLASCEG